MTAQQRKAAFRQQADLDGKTLNAVAYEVCGVTWFHLAGGIADQRPMSIEVKQKFAAYIGKTVEEVFGPSQASDAA